jgi:hypothetical protein
VACLRSALLRLLSAIRARPSGVFGPVLHPPCSWHFVMPGTQRAWQGVPFRVFAPHRGRRRLGRRGGGAAGSPRSAPIAARSRRQASIRASSAASNSSTAFPLFPPKVHDAARVWRRIMLPFVTPVRQEAAARRETAGGRCSYRMFQPFGR